MQTPTRKDLEPLQAEMPENINQLHTKKDKENIEKMYKFQIHTTLKRVKRYLAAEGPANYWEGRRP